MPFISGANYFSGADDAIKIAIIGCGGRGTGAITQALSTKQNVKLVAMADAFRDRLDDCYKELTSDDADATVKKRVDVPEERKYTGFDAYKKAMAHADVVILTTPPGFRPLHFTEAVNQGKQIFMEKPVATDPAGIKKVLDAAVIAKEKKLNVIVGLQRHYQNSYRELYSRKNLIGDITSAQAWWDNDGVWVRPRKPDQTEMEYQMRNWYYFVWLCGDHIVEQHIHNIDVINWTNNIQLLIQRSLTPAKITSIDIDEEKKHATVFLKPDQVSLAIGRRGVNIKLACELTGYEIDVFRDNEGEVDEFDIDLEEFSDEIEPWVIEALKKVGCDTARSVLDLTAEELERRTDLEKETIADVMRILKEEFEKE